MKKKTVGYTAEQTKSMKKLIERTEPNSGDYVGSGTVTEVPKKKKPKRMMNGGRVVTGVPMNPSSRGKVRRKIGQAGGMAGRAIPPGQMPGAMPVRTAGGLGTMASQSAMRGAMRGGGLARKGVGQALAAGGAVRACGVAQKGKTKGKMV